MIVSASRRTDIPAFHSEWLLHRLEAGFALAANPYRPKQLVRVPLERGLTDCMVFWTKNPGPLASRLDLLDRFGIPYYFQFTLTPYGPALEPGLPDKRTLIRCFRQMAEQIGPGRMVWRYDPILLGDGLTVEEHLPLFRKMAVQLKGATRRCVISFLDLYPRMTARMGTVYRPPTEQECRQLAAGLGEIGGELGLEIVSCCEKLDLSPWGIRHGACIDSVVISDILGEPLKIPHHAGQRPDCGCVQSVDIGSYDCCTHGCLYCYGTTSARAAAKRMAACDPLSPMLGGWPPEDGEILEKDWPVFSTGQMKLF